MKTDPAWVYRAYASLYAQDDSRLICELINRNYLFFLFFFCFTVVPDALILMSRCLAMNFLCVSVLQAKRGSLPEQRTTAAAFSAAPRRASDQPHNQLVCILAHTRTHTFYHYIPTFIIVLHHTIRCTKADIVAIFLHSWAVSEVRLL